MRVLGLLSGGKDSVYSLMCAVRAGHTLVGVAHIAAQRAGAEVDSYMYQTVGSEAAAGVAECLGVPFFSAVRAGDAVTQALDYGAAAVPGDEVETMHALLRAVRERHGVAFDAVVSGAILSTYQKTRVESVCARLGVASLAPLWQRDQAELLAAMVRDGLVAVLVKVACLGLDARHLGLTLAQAQPHLTSLVCFVMDLVLFCVVFLFTVLMFVFVSCNRVPSTAPMFVVKVESTNHLFWTVQSSRNVLSCLLIWFCFCFVVVFDDVVTCDWM